MHLYNKVFLPDWVDAAEGVAGEVARVVACVVVIPNLY